MPEFHAEVQTEAKTNPFIELPEAMVLALGAGKRPPLRTTINGVPYRTRVAVYGGRYYLGLRKDVVEASGAVPGSTARISVQLDETPREVQVPADLARALAAAPDAKTAFDGLAFTHRKEYVSWIEEAKRLETRRTRVQRTVTMLQEGTKTPG
ncbi:MAG: YdeI/OmpD-associated family protein [Candidatus Dormibacteraeota bacterium]|nr:YdeI/OmpD-associated family protein [Candidatus Dormibacteraeota bacterium]